METTFRLNLDTVKFTRKPDSEKGEVGAIKNRLPYCRTEITGSALEAAIAEGRTFTCGELSGTKKESWISQRLICLDVDNGEKILVNGEKVDVRADVILPVLEAESELIQRGIYPYLVYESFRSRPEWPRYHILILLNETITDPDIMDDMVSRLIQIHPARKEVDQATGKTHLYGGFDEGVKDRARIFYGTTAGKICLHCTGQATPADVIRALDTKPLQENRAAEGKKAPDLGIVEPQAPEDEEGAEWYEYICRHIDEILACIPCRETKIWVHVGIALKSMGFSFSLFDEWSRENGEDKYQPKAAAHYWELWKKLDPIKDAMMKIYHAGKEHGWIPPKEDMPRMRPQNGAKNDFIGVGKEMPTDTAEAAIESPDAPQDDPMEFFDQFLEKIQTEAYKPIKTGMAEFDEMLGGGVLPQSLIILSAPPGIGKTTLAQQIFEVMAENGTDVIFFNLEMSREQLLSRSLARLTYEDEGRGRMTPAQVLQGYAWNEWQKKRVAEVAQAYRQRIAPRMKYNPGNCGTDLGSITKALEQAGEQARAAGKNGPVVVLDYLHLITSTGREDPMELIKKTVAMLKGYAVKYSTFVLAIAANNRSSNHSGKISLDSARDSSSIEYTADYQIGLNYRALVEKWTKPNGKYYDPSSQTDMHILQKATPRRVTLQIFKNRMNGMGKNVNLAFNAQNSVFVPDKSTTIPARMTNTRGTMTDEDEDPADED